MHVLFADDNRETRELFQLGFGLEGAIAYMVQDGAEALEAVKTESNLFDAIVLDIEMPVMDGWETLEKIRELPQAQQIPIVMFTGYSLPEYRTRALQSGANKVVYKPLMPHELVTILDELVQAQKIKNS